MKICTHDREFHTDDVLSLALLTELYPDAEVVRSRDPEVWAASDIVVDVGGVYEPERGRYDHHQLDPAVDRENGIRRSGFGLVWEHYGRRFCPDAAVWSKIDSKLAMPVDAGDNGQSVYDLNQYGVSPFQLEDVIKSFYPLAANSEETYDGQFKVAVELGRTLLKRLVGQETAKVEAGSKLVALYEAATDKRYVVATDYLPSKDVKDQLPELLYVVFPVNDGATWRVMAVDGDAPFSSRRRFPLDWGGLEGAALATKTGVADAVFCHRGGFIAVAGSREGAEKLVKLSLGE